MILILWSGRGGGIANTIVKRGIITFAQKLSHGGVSLRCLYGGTSMGDFGFVVTRHENNDRAKRWRDWGLRVGVDYYFVVVVGGELVGPGDLGVVVVVDSYSDYNCGEKSGDWS